MYRRFSPEAGGCLYGQFLCTNGAGGTAALAVNVCRLDRRHQFRDAKCAAVFAEGLERWLPMHASCCGFYQGRMCKR